MSFLLDCKSTLLFFVKNEFQMDHQALQFNEGRLGTRYSLCSQKF